MAMKISSSSSNNIPLSNSSSDSSNIFDDDDRQSINNGNNGFIHPELEHLSATMPSMTIINHNNDNNTGSNNNDTTTTSSCSSSLSSNNVRSQSRMSISQAKGLLNMPGQNNCFLNSAVQVLWHLDIFRRSFRELGHGHACMGDSCIFCALKELFNQFQSSKESALPPDSLRFALAEAFSDQRRFQLGYMDDAAECFENILFRIHYHLTNEEIDGNNGDGLQCAPHCIPHQKFSMSLHEQIVCYSCGAHSEPLAFSQMVHYTSTSALCSQYEAAATGRIQLLDDEKNFGSLLRRANAIGDIRNCPKMCGAKINIRRTLLNRPDIVSVGLVWDSDHPTPALIQNVFQLIDTTINLGHVFDLKTIDETNETNKIDQKLNLVGLVTYYGKHYSTYLFHTRLSQWIYFDDATVRVVGPFWQQVVDRCLKGRFQPLLLLYSNPDATVVDTRKAFKKIVPMTAIKRNQNSHGLKRSSTSNNIISQKNSSNLLKRNSFSSFEANYSQLNSHQSNIDASDSSFNQMNPLKYFSDVPDSPSAASTTSYFSDVCGGDSTDGYISRKTVENIMKIQQQRNLKNDSQKVLNVHQNFKQLNNKRNSSCSLESFDSTASISKHHFLTNSLARPTKITPNSLISSLQRRDSGNSGSERSSSISSIDALYYLQHQKSLKLSNGNNRNKSKVSHSDQGYDSFSVSSTDSYPSSTAATSPSKLNTRLKQIPEDVLDIDFQNLVIDDEDDSCNKFCSEVEVLLLQSHEKEREGDLRAAAALSDSAAAKARLAMDAPYNNHQTLISAKMKHSMCVMRSASLHKRVLEIETEEKRLLKAAHEAAHHSRQSSRDSTGHGRHSRQGSRDSKDPKNSKETKIETTKLASGSSMNNMQLSDIKNTVEIYATLPKKSKRKSSRHESASISDHNSGRETEILSQFEAKQSIIYQLQNEKNTSHKTGKDIAESSDYYCEWEGYKRTNKGTSLNKTYSNHGSQNQENDSEGYVEIGSPSSVSIAPSGAKQRQQCKVKRKLLFASLLKSKNRSLPDLRENAICEKNDSIKELPKSVSKSNEDQQVKSTSVANINAKGFHQPHRSFLAEQGLQTKPLLVKVKPPLVASLPSTIPDSSQQIKRNNRPPPPPIPVKNSKISMKAAGKFASIINEFNQRDKQVKSENFETFKILNACDESKMLPLPPPPSTSELLDNAVNDQTKNSLIRPQKPNLLGIATFISKSSSPHEISQYRMESNPMSFIQMPIPINPAYATTTNSNGYGIRPNRPPDYETAIKRRIGGMVTEKNSCSAMFPPPPPPLSPLTFFSNKTTISSLPNENSACIQYDAEQIGVSRNPSRNLNGVQSSSGTLAKSFSSSSSSSKIQHSIKKSVKFSDRIELVACADDYDPEEHLPNPLFEKVLSNRSLVYTLQQ